MVADLQSVDFVRKVGPERAGEYLAALNDLAPLADKNGKARQAEALRPAFEGMADEAGEYVAARYGTKMAPLHRQSFVVDERSTEALHCALDVKPANIAAYKPIGEWTIALGPPSRNSSTPTLPRRRLRLEQ